MVSFPFRHSFNIQILMTESSYGNFYIYNYTHVVDFNWISISFICLFTICVRVLSSNDFSTPHFSNPYFVVLIFCAIKTTNICFAWDSNYDVMRFEYNSFKRSIEPFIKLCYALSNQNMYIDLARIYWIKNLFCLNIN